MLSPLVSRACWGPCAVVRLFADLCDQKLYILYSVHTKNQPIRFHSVRGIIQTVTFHRISETGEGASSCWAHILLLLGNQGLFLCTHLSSLRFASGLDPFLMREMWQLSHFDCRRMALRQL